MGDDYTIIWILAIGLGLACIFGYIAQKLKQPPTIGYLLAGFFIGPNAPGFIADAFISDQLANIGVTLLMFAVGLSFSFEDLFAVRKLAVPGALILSSVSFLAGLFYCRLLNETLLSGVVFGLALSVSSTVVIVRVLFDRGLLHTNEGHLALGWTIVEDLISVFGLLFLPALATASGKGADSSGNIFFDIFLVLSKIALFGVFVHLFGGKAVERLLKIVARTRSHELFTLAILSTTFLIAIGSAYLFGVSIALGAFIAGTIVGKTDMSYQAAANALPMRDAFSVLFFVSVGMLFSPLTLLDNIPLFLGILCIVLLLRPILAFTLVKVAKYPFESALTIALAIAQIGEYSFILAEEGSKLGILPSSMHDMLVAGAFVTIMVNPILFRVFRAKSKPIRQTGDSLKEFSIEQLEEPKHGKFSFLPRAIVVGFGPVGQAATKKLLKKGYHVTIVDQNIDSISSIKNQELEAIFGDATQFHILEKAQTENACLVITTIPELSVTQTVVYTARQMNPHIKIIARIRFMASLQSHSLEDVSIICDEQASSEKLDALLDKELESAHLGTS